MSKLKDATPKPQGDTVGDMLLFVFGFGFLLFICPILVGALGG